MLTGFEVWGFAASLIAAILYAWDKQAAIKDRARIPEKTLLTISLLGGWPGAWIAGRFLRHKTRKVSYRVWFAVCVTLNVIGTSLLLWYG